jgi:chorismate-pyruvate lyase
VTILPDIPNLSELISLFYNDAAQLGVFTAVTEAALPNNARTLLAHHAHMTVTVERFYQSPVNVAVLQVKRSNAHYAREIQLHKQTDHQTVQYGIVRMNFDYVSQQVRADIESEKIPLGRVLINHNVLREVQLVQLWQIRPGPVLQQVFQVLPTQFLFGRTALIYCDKQPAVELLEIVAPAYYNSMTV